MEFDEGAQFFLDIGIKTAALFDGGRIGFQEHFTEPDGTQGAGNRIDELTVLGDDEFGTAAADVDDKSALFRARPARFDAEMDETRFFRTGNDFDICAESGVGAIEEIGLIAGVADGTGGDSADANNLKRFVGSSHAFERGAQEGKRGSADEAGAKNTFTEAHNLTILRQDRCFTVADFRSHHANGVAANVDGGITRHI